MLLKDYIDNHCDSLRQFCRDADVNTQSVQRWVKMGCTINTKTGEIIRTQVKHKCKEWVIV